MAQEQNQTADANTSASNAPVFHIADMVQKRVLASLIDFIIVAFAALLLVVISRVVLPELFAILAGCCINCAAACLMLIKDIPLKIGELDGQTIGKKIMNIRVTTLDKKPITAEQSIKRNLVFVLPFIPGLLSTFGGYFSGSYLIFFFVILILVFLLSLGAIGFEIYRIYAGERNRRMGDIVAGTIVSWD